MSVHKKCANTFFELLQVEADSEMTMAFDCQKNFDLPRIPDHIAYYSS